MQGLSSENINSMGCFLRSWSPIPKLTIIERKTAAFILIIGVRLCQIFSFDPGGFLWLVGGHVLFGDADKAKALSKW